MERKGANSDMVRDFTALMNQLKNKELDEFEVGPDDFQAFQQAYMAFDTRKRVIGQAHKNGKLVYHYDHDAGNQSA